MATAQHPAAPKPRGGVQPLRAGEGTSFLWRKLHSLLGIIPIGAFFVEHLALKLRSAQRARRLRRAGKVPQFPASCARARMGLHLPAHPVSRPLRHVHLAARKVERRLLSLGRQLDVRCSALDGPDRHRSTSCSMCCASASWASAFLKIPARHSKGAARTRRIPIMLAVYVIAMIAICWHFAYGIWLFAAKWGITPGPVARKRFGYACAALGVVLADHGPGQHLGFRQSRIPERA